MKHLIVLSLVAAMADCSAASAGDLNGDAAFALGDYAAARQQWLTLADQGDPSAMLGVGVLYDTGHGANQDFTTALNWYRRAALLGDVVAAFNVGAMYDNGRGIAMNRAEAVRWYKRAANGGYGRAAYNLGVIYRDGDGLPKERAAAVRYFQLAVKLGVPAGKDSLEALGVVTPKQIPDVRRGEIPIQTIPVTNQSIVADIQKTVLARGRLEASQAKIFSEMTPKFEVEAARGNHVSEYNAGYAYQFGLGVYVNPERAYVFYLLAAADSSPQVRDAALNGAAEVGQQMTDKQHQSARVRLLEGGW